MKGIPHPPGHVPQKRRYIGSDQMSQTDLETWSDKARYAHRWRHACQVAGLVRCAKGERPMGPLGEVDGELVELRGWRPWGEDQGEAQERRRP